MHTEKKINPHLITSDICLNHWEALNPETSEFKDKFRGV